jgi:hypothetical protein
MRELLWRIAVVLLFALCLTPLLSSCAANYHFCPAGGATQDPSRSFAPCQTPAPSQPQGQ